MTLERRSLRTRHGEAVAGSAVAQPHEPHARGDVVLTVVTGEMLGDLGAGYLGV
jgi:hypothetical protein